MGTKYAVGVSSGTDALKLATAALNLEGNVGIIIPANTFIATILGIEQGLSSEVNAEFSLIDCDDYYQIDISLLEEELRKNRSKWDDCLLVPVHLYGHSADMSSILALAERYNCKILEDASQSHGTVCENGKLTGNIGHIAAFSLYPGKNLGGAGDGGIVATNDPNMAKNVELLRNYGSKRKYYYEFKGFNNRLDTIQAIILKEKLKHLKKWNKARNEVSGLYDDKITNKKVKKPSLAPYCKYHTYHVYCVRVDNRENFMEYLNENGIQCGIHYPVPIELTKPYNKRFGQKVNRKTREFAAQLVSLPIHPFMTRKEVDHVCKIINQW